MRLSTEPLSDYEERTRLISNALSRAEKLWGEQTVCGLLGCVPSLYKSLKKGDRSSAYLRCKAEFIFCEGGFPSRDEASLRRRQFIPERTRSHDI